MVGNQSANHAEDSHQIGGEMPKRERSDDVHVSGECRFSGEKRNEMILFYLIAAHCLCDYPLQGDFLAKAKNNFIRIPGVPWYQALFAHSMIHAGAVALITGSLWLGVAEFLCHAFIDHLKCAEEFGFNTDQALHIACKIGWFLWLLNWR